MPVKAIPVMVSAGLVSPFCCPLIGGSVLVVMMDALVLEPTIDKSDAFFSLELDDWTKKTSRPVLGLPISDPKVSGGLGVMAQVMARRKMPCMAKDIKKATPRSMRPWGEVVGLL